MVFHLLEGWITRRLLSSPLFHRAIRIAHKKAQEIKHGEKLIDTTFEGSKDPHGPVGPNDMKKISQYFFEELRNQLPGGGKKP